MSVDSEEKLGLPLGLKIIWFLQIFGLITSTVAVFSKPMPVIVGQWVLPSILSNLYIATVLVSQGYIVFGLPKFLKQAWGLLVFIQVLGICLMASHLFISPELLNQFINSTQKQELTIGTYQSFILPAICLQSVILLYVIQKRSLFNQ